MKKPFIIVLFLIIPGLFPGRGCFAKQAGSSGYNFFKTEVLSDMQKPRKKINKSEGNNKHLKNDRKSKRLKKAYDCGCK
jgi:hypothetical protein